jgi:fatty-acyl-CoA synthase
VFPDKPALRSDRYNLCWRELNGRVNRLANALKAADVARGDRVATLMFNVIEQVEVVFACAKIGAVCVPMNFRLTPAEMAAQLADCTPCLLIRDVDLWRTADGAQALYQQPLRSVVVGRAQADTAAEGYEAFLASAREDEALDPAVGGDDLLFLMYTAGTTGAAKGVMLSHANVFWQTVNALVLGLDPRAVGLVLLPLFHTGGMNASVLPLMHVGATVVLQKRWDPAEVLKCLERERVSGVVGVPVQYQLMMESPQFDSTDLSSVAALISGGGPLSDTITARYLEKGLRFTQGYGLTEASPGVTGMLPDEFATRHTSIGRECMYIDTRVVDAEGRECAPGVEGEVICRGPNVMLGYWGRPEETAQVLKDGWLYTGDLAYRDQAGYFYLSGRKKELIISGGENIHPSEVENVLCAHPSVAEAAVVGAPDPRWTEVPVAAVVRRGPDLTEAALLAFAGERLARYKVPQRVMFVEALPRNAAGKLVKPEIKKLFA